jgi:hypothetical protein
MGTLDENWPPSSGFNLDPRFQSALVVLLEAFDYAVELGRPVWDFAVEIGVLRRAGLTNSDLRWLVCQGIVEHGAEGTGADQKCRMFHRTGVLTFRKQTCFVLTEIGAELARNQCNSLAQPDNPARQPPRAPNTPVVPEWDKERQELRVGGLVVKQFKVPAPNQEMILAAFQEEGWPPRIDDPLPPQAGQNPCRRLHDTIMSLNRHQKHPLLRFSGDGSGEGVRWEFANQANHPAAESPE